MPDSPIPLEDVLALVAHRPPSVLFAHDDTCCQVARAWFTSMARSIGAQEAGPPLWIRERWRWGPVDWPLYWCDAMAAERLDCGALAALGRCAVESLGGAALPVQLIQRFDPSTVASWHDSWREAALPPWTWVDFVYHEAIALLDGDTVAVWDTTSGYWVDGKATVGYASLAAIRITSASGAPSPESVNWRDRMVQVGAWHRLEEMAE